MVIQSLASKTVFLDTAPLIYFIEGQSPYQNSLARLFDFNDKGSFTFITSVITLLEVLVKPLREGKATLAQQYKDILTTATGIEVFDVSSTISEVTARLRADYDLRTPDSIQMATAIQMQADYFLTNDNRLKSITEITAISVGDLQ